MLTYCFSFCGELETNKQFKAFEPYLIEEPDNRRQYYSGVPSGSNGVPQDAVDKITAKREGDILAYGYYIRIFF